MLGCSWWSDAHSSDAWVTVRVRHMSAMMHWKWVKVMPGTSNPSSSAVAAAAALAPPGAGLGWLAPVWVCC